MEKSLNEALVFFDKPRSSQGDGSGSPATLSPPPTHPKPQQRDEYFKLWHPPIVYELSQADDEATGIRSKIPFVQPGWFTAQEVLTYLEL